MSAQLADEGAHRLMGLASFYGWRWLSPVRPLIRALRAHLLPRGEKGTCEPGPDIAGHHNRQVVVLEPADWRAWLYGTKAEGEVLRPSAAGVFRAGLG